MEAQSAAMASLSTTNFPYFVRASKKYRSPHTQDLSFSKGAVIKVTAQAPRSKDEPQQDDDEEDDEEDIWLVGELKDGTAHGTFPASFVTPAPEADDTESPSAIESQGQGVKSLTKPATTTHEVEAGEDVAAEAQQPQPDTSSSVSLHSAQLKDGEPTSEAHVITSLPRSEPVDDPEIPDVVEPSKLSTTADSQAKANREDSSTSGAIATSAGGPTEAVPGPEKVSAVAPNTTVKSVPPPTKPKPSGLAARIAAFNQPQAAAAPPPLPRGGKPIGAWKKPAPKDVDSANPSRDSTAIKSPRNQEEDHSSSNAVSNADMSGRANEGFSAADAASSIKMSLKERMAALQRGGSENDADAAGQGLPKVPSAPGSSSRPVRAVAPSPQTASSRDDLDESKRSSVDPDARENGDSEKQGALSAEQEVEKEPAFIPAVDRLSQRDDPSELRPSADKEPEDEASATPEAVEEEGEAQRRAAIAARMAKLGGHRFGGPGPALFGSPKPPSVPAKKPSTQTSSPSKETDAAEVSPIEQREKASTSAEGASKTTALPKTEEQPATLSVPRRAAPPRKKRSALASPDDARKSSESILTDLPAANTTEDRDVPQPQSGASLGGADLAPTIAPSSHLPDEVGEPELVSGRPPPENIADPGKLAEHVKAKEATAPIEAVDDLTESYDSVADMGEKEELLDEDEALQRQADQLTSFLHPSRRGSAKTESSLDRASMDASMSNAQSVDFEGSAIPPALAQQLGLTPSSETPHFLQTEPEQRSGHTSPLRGSMSESEQRTLEQRTLGEQANASRPATPEPSEGPAQGASQDSENLGLSRPPSTRPPIPGSHRISVPPPAREVPTPPVIAEAGATDEYASSQTRRPPIPKSPPPPPSTSSRIMDTLSRPVGSGTEDSHGVATVDDASEATTPSPPLAAPQPRHAIPVDEDEPEDESVEKQEEEESNFEVPTSLTESDANSGAPDSHAGEATDTSHRAQAIQQEPQEPMGENSETAVELTPEQEEAERRARIAKRMAALGGQRMGGLPPIMGAPMPPRRKPTLPDSDVDQHSRQQDRPPVLEQSEAFTPSERGLSSDDAAIPDMTFATASDAKESMQGPHVGEPSEGSDALQELSEVERTKSPPMPAPRPPMSPPPRPPSAVSSSGATGSLGRRSSVRPPIPSAAAPPAPRSGQLESQPSIDTSLGSLAGSDARDDRRTSVGSIDGTARAYAASPPPLPVSPPPRAPPRPPSSMRFDESAGYQQSVAHPSRVASTGSMDEHADVVQSPAPPENSSDAKGHRDSIKASSRLSGHVSQQTSARDLDLAPASRWWRQAPLQIPPSITGRRDAVYSVDHRPGTGQAKIHVLFEDYSLTTVRASWEEGGDDAEDQTVLEQSHELAPPRPSAEEMRSWSGHIGVEIAKEALLLASSKGGSNVPPSSFGLASHLVTSGAAGQRALPPVGASFGVTVSSQVGSTVLDRGPDEVIRPGDVVLLQGADFKGKKGLGSYHVTYGTANTSSGQSAGSGNQSVYAVLVENDSKKNRWRVVTTSAAASPSSKPTAQSTVEEITLKMDDVRGGIIKVMRVPPRGGVWVKQF